MGLCATHLRLRNTGQRTKRHTAHIGKTYSITQEEYQELFEFQGGKCYICHKKPGFRRRLSVDHDHKIAREQCDHPEDKGCKRCLRGLLHSRCNSFLGWIRDDPEAMERGRVYLIDPPAQQLWRMINV